MCDVLHLRKPAGAVTSMYGKVCRFLPSVCELGWAAVA